MEYKTQETAPNATNAPNPTLIKDNLESVLSVGIETAIRSLDPNQIKEAKEQKEKTNTIEEQVKQARHEATSKAIKNPKKKAEYFKEFTKKTQEILAKNTDQKFIDASIAKFTQERLDNFCQWIYKNQKKIAADEIKNFVSKEIKPPIADPKDQAEFLRFAQYSLLQPKIEQESLEDAKFMEAFSKEIQKKAQAHADKTDQSWLDRIISILFGAKIGPNTQPEQHDEKNAKKTKGKTLSISGLPDGEAKEILDANGKATPPTLADLTLLGLENGVANNNPNYKFHQLAIQNTALVKTLMDQNNALMPNKIATLHSGGINYQTDENSWNATIGYLNANDNDITKNKATILNVQMHNGSSLIVTGCSADEGIKNTGFFLYHLDDKGQPLKDSKLDNNEIKMRFDFLKDLQKNQEQLDNLKALVIKTDPNAKTYSPQDTKRFMDFVKSIGSDGKLQENVAKYFADNPQKNDKNKDNPNEALRPYYEAFQKDPSRFIKANVFINEQENKFKNSSDQQTYMTNELNAYLKNPSLYEQSAHRNKMSLVEKQDQNHTALITTINAGTISYAVQDYNKEKDRALDAQRKTTIKEDPKGVIFASQANVLFTNAAKNPNDKSVSSTRGVSHVNASQIQTVAIKITDENKAEKIAFDKEPNASLAKKYSQKLLTLNKNKLEALKKIQEAYENKQLGKKNTNQEFLEAQKNFSRILDQETKLMREMEEYAEKHNPKSANSVNDKQNAQQLVKTFMTTWYVKLAERQNRIPTLITESKTDTKEKTKDHPNQPLSAKDLAQNQQHQQSEQAIQERFQEHHSSIVANVKEGKFNGKVVGENLLKKFQMKLLQSI